MASSSSSSSSSVVPRSKKEEWKYDVYVSFKGGDTRNIFVGHLYGALALKGISVFMEDKIDSEELLEAIKESRWAIVVFSKDYANSSWRLEELSNIMENSKQIGQRVLPVFYRVDPSVIHGQKGELAKAFESHEHMFRGDMDKVNKWREALTAAASLSGQHILPDYGGEVEVISNVAEEISAYIRPHGASRKKNDLVVLEPWVNALYSSVLQTIKGEWTYDVFLSFSDKDTGNNFTDHLYAALDREIRVFRPGYAEQTISADVMKAIFQSRLVVVVFSKNYAKSPLCLEELSTIMNCQDLMGVPKKVLPVLYHVDQSDIRVQEGDQLDKWRDALTAATNLRGTLCIRHDNTEGESAYVEGIVKQVLVNLEISERKIGKLLFSEKEIGGESNDAIVLLEGFYEIRFPVKRIKKEHFDVDMKEIKNLINSDNHHHHPNIVRYYGVEENEEFVYIALDRCICNLHELILTPTTVDQSQLTSLEGESFKVRKPIEYPSPELLKVMRGTAAGLAHLHERGITHGDLKPQNVLICKYNSIISARVSDMGIKIKGLPTNMSSLTSATDPFAVDLFSLGCLLFFCMTGGHPFGDDMHDQRNRNIENNISKDLWLLNGIPEAYDLVSNLIHSDPKFRPSAAEVYHHPLFWDPDRRLSFLRAVSERLPKEDLKTSTGKKQKKQNNNNSPLLKALERTGDVALGVEHRWNIGTFDTELLELLKRHGQEEYYNVRGLIEAIRNTLTHYDEYDENIKKLLGDVPTGFDAYFSKRFPNLLIEVYKIVKEHCGKEEKLKEFFKKTVD